MLVEAGALERWRRDVVPIRSDHLMEHLQAGGYTPCSSWSAPACRRTPQR